MLFTILRSYLILEALWTNRPVFSSSSYFFGQWKVADKYNLKNETLMHSREILPTGQIYARGIFLEHSHDIFPEYLEKVSYEIPGNILK